MTAGFSLLYTMYNTVHYGL